MNQNSSDLNQTIGEIVRYIQATAQNTVELGTAFEKLVIKTLPKLKDLDIKECYWWADWEQREELTGLDGQDIGIDLIAKRNDDKWISIQCKCFQEDNHVYKKDIDSFLAVSQMPEIFTQRWIITTSDWSPHADKQIKKLTPIVKRIDFLKYADVVISQKEEKPEIRQLKPKQQKAVDDVIDGFKHNDRGKLIMACGTGKTFTSLRIAEEIVEEGGLILFVAPSIALVSQARREWLTHTQRPLQSLVICSDSSAGGKKEGDTPISELACDVTTDSFEIAEMLKEYSGQTKVIFCTYQSLWSVINAQREYNAPAFDLTLCDEAHRTTGVDRSRSDKGENTGFQAVHHDLQSNKCLYMTATERIYTTSSKKSLKSKGIEIIDMDDPNVYGAELSKLKFKDAVEEGMLTDYRVIVMGISIDDKSISESLKTQLIELGQDDADSSKKPLIITNEDLQKVIITSQAINGVVQGKDSEKPLQLYRSIIFANTINRSKYYAKALQHPELLDHISEKKAGQVLDIDVQHLDASDSSHARFKALEKLAQAEEDNTARVLCNVGLFGEGVDVPTLDAIVFMEPRKSQIEIVQAVGRVMRRADDKHLGYIIVPIPVAEGQSMEQALAEGTNGYEVIGQVLRALQSHDERLAKNLATFVEIYAPPKDTSNDSDDEGRILTQQTMRFEKIDGDKVYSQLVSASGLGKAGKLITEQIEYAIDRATAILMEGRNEALEGADFIHNLAKALGEQVDNNEKDICKIGSLLIANACLLQKRLQTVDIWQSELTDMAEIGRSGNDASNLLKTSWLTILKRDYKPVFEPALAVLNALPDRPYVSNCVCMLVECANRVADELTDLDYNHAVSLYHKIMPNAKEMGAYYTKNLSALLLAKLSIKEDFVNWHDEQAISNLKIMDVACGTGTLLMASVKIMKEHFAQAHNLDLNNIQDKEKLSNFHKLLVENVIHGLDINQCGIQLSASNLTLGSPNVDYRRMNLHTLKYGIQSNSTVRAGSLDILKEDNQLELIQTVKTNTQVNNENVSFPTEDIDMVIINPPFKNNVDRNSQYSPEDKRRMQQYEKTIYQDLLIKDKFAGDTVDFNSIATFFTPISDKIINSNKGVLAKVIPVTACTGSSGLKERQFLATRFHIERIIVSHDPKCPNFSENTGINECLLIGRRHEGNKIVNKPTEFISLKQLPKTSEEVEELYQAIKNKVDDNKWITRTDWSSDLMKAGDWSPAQWLNGKLTVIAQNIQENKLLEPSGNRYKILVGQSVRGTFEECDENDAGARKLFWSISSKIRNKMLGEAESWRCPKSDKLIPAENCWKNRSHVLVAQKMNTIINSLTAVHSNKASIGSLYMPVYPIENEIIGKGLVSWWNSTVVLLMLLNARSRLLTYPSWSGDQLKSISIPKLDNPAWDDLYQAFEQTKNKEILTLKDGERCEVRKIIDRASAKALGIPEGEIAQWRSMLAKEPTISGKYAENT